MPEVTVIFYVSSRCKAEDAITYLPLKGGGRARSDAGGGQYLPPRKLRGRDPHPTLPLSGGGLTTADA